MELHPREELPGRRSEGDYYPYHELELRKDYESDIKNEEEEEDKQEILEQEEMREDRMLVMQVLRRLGDSSETTMTEQETHKLKERMWSSLQVSALQHDIAKDRRRIFRHIRALEKRYEEILAEASLAVRMVSRYRDLGMFEEEEEALANLSSLNQILETLDSEFETALFERGSQLKDLESKQSDLNLRLNEVSPEMRPPKFRPPASIDISINALSSESTLQATTNKGFRIHPSQKLYPEERDLSPPPPPPRVTNDKNFLKHSQARPSESIDQKLSSNKFLESQHKSFPQPENLFQTKMKPQRGPTKTAKSIFIPPSLFVNREVPSTDSQKPQHKSLPKPHNLHQTKSKPLRDAAKITKSTWIPPSLLVNEDAPSISLPESKHKPFPQPRNTFQAKIKPPRDLSNTPKSIWIPSSLRPDFLTHR